MNTEKAPTIYGTVTFEQFSDATRTVCKYVEGLANTYAIKDLITEEHRNKLGPDILMGSLLMMPVNMAYSKLIGALEGIQAELLENKAAKERAAQADPSEPARAEPGNTYGPKTENL